MTDAWSPMASDPEFRPDAFTVVIVAKNPLVAIGVSRLIEAARIPGVADVLVPSSGRFRREAMPTSPYGPRDRTGATVMVLLDDGDEGLSSALRFVRRGTPLVAVVQQQLTASDLALALSTGVMWITDPDDGFAALSDALQSVINGRSGWTVAQLLKAAEARTVQQLDLPTLTPRELELMRAMQLGAANKALAVQLGVTPKTVEAMQRVLYRKLGVRNRMEAVYRYETTRSS